jgi:predicted ATPase
LIEKAAALWGKAGERSVERSALVEAVELLTRALDQIATLPSSPALRREQIKLQVALISPLIHIKGYAAPETKAATEDARFLMERAEKLGEATEDPLLLFAVLYGFSIVNYLKFDGEAFRASASEFLALAQKHGATVPLVTGHRLMGHALLLTGDIVGARTHYTKSLALYHPAEHRTLAMRIGAQDAEMAAVTHRGRALWLLGYPTAALADAERGVAVAREVGHAVTLMYGLTHAAFIQIHCGQFQSASDMIDEAVALAEEKNSAIWKAVGQLARGWIFSLSDNSLDAVRTLVSGLSANRSSGATVWRPFFLSYEARALSQLGQFGDAWQRVGEAMTTIETAKERVWEAEVHRIAGEIALASPEPDVVKAEAYFDHALTVARQQQAKSWELRAAMSLARLWRDRGKVRQARELLAPVYGWFTEGFDTRDLKEAKALLEQLS